MVKELSNNLSGYVSNWSYVAFDGAIENCTLTGGTYNAGNANFSIGVGADVNANQAGLRISPMAEGKINYNFGKGFTAQARGRVYGDENKNPVFQARATMTKKFEIPVKNLTPYVAAHMTDKIGVNGHNFTTGGWIGASYNINKNLTVLAELQQNIPVNGDFKWNDNSKRMVNIGISYKF